MEKIEQNKLIAEFDGKGYWKVFVKDHHYEEPYWANHFSTKEEAEQRIKECDEYNFKRWGDKVAVISDETEVKFVAPDYHKDWNLLMPVVEKICDLRIKSKAEYNPDLSFRIEIVNGYSRISGTGQDITANSSIEGSMLLATYSVVIQFIEWYNQNKPQ